MLWVKGASPCNGLPHLLGLSRVCSFSPAWGEHTSCFLCPRAASPFCTGQQGRWGLAAVVAAPRALAQSYLVNTARSFDNFLLHWSLEILSICIKKKKLRFLCNFTNSDTFMLRRTYRNWCLFLMSTYWVIYLNKQQAKFLKSSISPTPNFHESFVSTDTWGKKGRTQLKNKYKWPVDVDNRVRIDYGSRRKLGQL